MKEKQINIVKHAIEDRFKELGWVNNELFTSYKSNIFSVQVNYFTGKVQKHKNTSKINWHVNNGAEYEKWFFEVIEDIMFDYDLAESDFIFHL